MLISTPRLILQEFTTDDSEFMLKLLNTPSWLKYIGDRGVRTDKQAKKYLLNSAIKSYRENGFGVWRVSLKETGTVIGLYGLINREGLDGIDL